MAREKGQEPIVVVNLQTMREGTKLASVTKEEAETLKVDIVMPNPREEGRGYMDLTGEINQEPYQIIE